MKKRGRPPKENSREKQYRLRLNEEEYAKIEYLAARKGVTAADILRKGVDILFIVEKLYDEELKENFKKT